VPEQRASADLDQRLGFHRRFFAQARAEAACQNDRFHQILCFVNQPDRRVVWRAKGFFSPQRASGLEDFPAFNAA
jgi:hypothetical protein